MRLTDEQIKKVWYDEFMKNSSERYVETLTTVVRRCLALAALPDEPKPYGYCPTCGKPGKTRERRIYGNDTCEEGHVYPSNAAVGGDTYNDVERRGFEVSQPGELPR